MLRPSDKASGPSPAVIFVSSHVLYTQNNASPLFNFTPGGFDAKSSFSDASHRPSYNDIQNWNSNAKYDSSFFSPQRNSNRDAMTPTCEGSCGRKASTGSCYCDAACHINNGRVLE